jgi:hypothetical protein
MKQYIMTRTQECVEKELCSINTGWEGEREKEKERERERD